ncbi:GINS4 [Mytilus edulis]|uniref:GINS complex subunit 4 n=1 Tax=Mytilus edulis TaxID=6550 RepID=A0A8S3SBL1_MYTED|nr:GINS4 [Mytilus edulis]
MTVLLTNLPPELIIRILEDLPSRDIGLLSGTCTQLRSICRTDIVWQKLCQKICDIEVEEWDTTYYNIYTKGQFHTLVDNGRLLATEYKPPYVSDIHGPLRPKKVFSISINKSKNRTEILCLHGYGEAHPGSIEFETEESDIVFKCCQMSSHAHPKGSSVELSTLIKEETNNHTIPFTIDDQKRLECYMKNVQKYRLTRIEVQKPDPVYPIQPGLFQAHYSAHGIEMFLLKYDMSKKEAEVIKITGDLMCLQGETSIYINLRKPMQLTKDQQLDVNSLLLLEEDDIPDSDDVQPRNQPFAWLNEKFSPDLLECKVELVECMIDQITEMEENIKEPRKGDFKISIHRMEIDRIRYVLSSYLRLKNIQSYILEQDKQRKEEEPCKLSQEEFTFAKEYAETLEEHLRNVALRHMPPNLQTLDPKQTGIINIDCLTLKYCKTL